jgi:hypothetical protein
MKTILDFLYYFKLPILVMIIILEVVFTLYLFLFVLPDLKEQNFNLALFFFNIGYIVASLFTLLLGIFAVKRFLKGYPVKNLIWGMVLLFVFAICAKIGLNRYNYNGLFVEEKKEQSKS